MANTYRAGDRVVHMTPTTIGDTPVADPQVMGASETNQAFTARVAEMAGLAVAMRSCRDGTCFTAMRTRADAIDD